MITNQKLEITIERIELRRRPWVVCKSYLLKVLSL
jgi:hypothetical protein